jgi:hypothetical protein
MESSCENTELAVAVSRQGVFLQLGGWALSKQFSTVENKRVARCYTGSRALRIWEDNIKMDLTEIMLEGVDWIHLARDRKRLWALVKTVRNFRVSYKARNFLTI